MSDSGHVLGECTDGCVAEGLRHQLSDALMWKIKYQELEVRIASLPVVMKEGFRTGRSAVMRDDNPHPDGSIEADTWDQGWLLGYSRTRGTAQQRRYFDLLKAVHKHHDQKADDRCVEDDDKLYEAAGLPPCDRRVGDKAAMLKNCERFIDKRCEGGGWPSYKELENALKHIASLDNVLGEFPGHAPPPIPRALDLWKECVETAKKALKYDR